MNRSYRHCQLWLALWWLSAASLAATGGAFAPPSYRCHLPTRTTATDSTTSTAPNRPQRHHHQQQHQHQPLNYSKRDARYDEEEAGRDGDGGRFDEIEANILRNRLESLRVRALDRLVRQPPHPSLSPTEFVAALLRGLRDNADPLPDAGFRLLLAASTKPWRRELYRAVGAPATADEEVVASALGEALGRPHNQFGLLVGADDDDDDGAAAAAGDGDETKESSYVATFPSDPLEYADDGTAWVECQLRDAADDALLATTGWQLQKVNGSWLVDGITWQDFRDEFRPGIGREEWVRICG